MYAGENYFPKSIYRAFIKMEQRRSSATFYGDWSLTRKKALEKTVPPNVLVLAPPALIRQPNLAQTPNSANLGRKKKHSFSGPHPE